MVKSEGDNEDLPTVAPQLRARRHAMGLSLEVAAARADLSPAHLSRLETGQRQPSLPVLLTLSRCYGTTVSELLGEAPPESSPVIRGAEAPATHANGWTYRPAGQPGRAIQALRVEVPPDAQRDLVRVHPGEEWIHVLSGSLELSLGPARYVLEPGDSAHFDSLTPHQLRTRDPHPVELLFLHTLLRSTAAEMCLGPPRPEGHRPDEEGR
ncbi:XRE family transcriptional regulator [Streptomyces sp. NPDC005438]|uniref:helix-turn-helix domain-containing protein n=1 Tax=Streptomyces sp. NPDC005438 TaxID=3156880 RepID=UPI0033A86188